MTGATVTRAAELLGFESWLPGQVEAFTHWTDKSPNKRMTVYYPTGQGKSETMLVCMYLDGAEQVVVVAPPITHVRWREIGYKLGIIVNCVSHAKFRMNDYLLDRNIPLIVDEVHMLGGHTGKGWRKLDRAAAGLRAGLILGSATPNYNDAERCYCIAHVMDPHHNKGGYISWLYRTCTTEENPFGAEPKVTGFLTFDDAESYLASLPYVVYLPDTAQKIDSPMPMAFPRPDEFERYGYDKTQHRLMASIMEKRHRRRWIQIVDEDGYLREHIREALIDIMGDATTPILFYCDHAEIAKVLAKDFDEGQLEYALITGATSAKMKDASWEAFKNREIEYLIGTATLATGGDGADKVCNYMVVLDDTDDKSLHRQLVGRILPRGKTPSQYKVAYVFEYDS